MIVQGQPPIKLQDVHGVTVLRDDLLPGGTKSVLMPSIVEPDVEYVYASPVYGGFQIALAAYCRDRATIFCAERKKLHDNTLRVMSFGASVREVPYGYLTVVEKRARKYVEQRQADGYKTRKLEFGANTEANRKILSERVKRVIDELGREPDEIWCAVGSGALIESILDGTHTAQLFGVTVGKQYENDDPRIKLIDYGQPFSTESKFKAAFPSMPNYDLKAFEICMAHRKSTNDNILFWNVL